MRVSNLKTIINIYKFTIVKFLINGTWSRIFKSAFQRIVNNIIDSGIIILQHLFQKGRHSSSNPIVLTFVKHHLFLTTFKRHSNYVSSKILLLFSKEIGNIGCAAYRMNIFIKELISKVSIVISNMLESISYHSP